MKNLKSLKDLIFDSINVNKDYQTGIIREDEIKAEAVKWVKFKEDDVSMREEVKDWIKHFFNITEDDLK